MSQDVAILLALLAATLVLFVTQVVRIEIVSIGIVVVLALTGILAPAEALSGFSSTATITVAAMLVISAGLQKAGAVDLVAARLVRLGERGYTGLLLALAVPTAVLSAFMNNTPIVALMIPVAITLGKRLKVKPSLLLLPISYFAILGGTCTLIGTSTNILVDSLYRAYGGPGFGMFEFTGMGLLYLLVGGAFVFLFARRLLPERQGLTELLGAGAPDQFVTEVRIPAGSRLIGKSLAEALHGAEEVTAIELVRDEQPFLRPGGEVVLREGDILLLEAGARTIHNLLAAPDLEHGTVIADDERVRIGRLDLHIAEAIVTPASSFRHRRVKDLGLSRRYGVQVLAVRRLGRQHQYKLRDFRIHSGDVLLIQGEPASLRLIQEDQDVLLMEGVQRELTFPRKAPLAIGILLAVVLLATAGVAPIAFLALAGAGLLVLTRCMDVADATRALDSGVLLLLAGTIPLGRALESTGIAGEIGGWVAGVAGDHGAIVLIGSFYLLTSVMTEILSNNATAVLLTPIGIGIAQQIGIDPKPILVAIAFGASASFATPLGYQTNTMVMGPGGYLFRDYLRMGIPMNVLLWLSATFLIPLFWPF